MYNQKHFTHPFNLYYIIEMICSEIDLKNYNPLIIGDSLSRLS